VSRAGDVFIKRQLWLILFGLVNAVLFLYPMDYLFHLGIVGILLFPLARLSQQTIFIAAMATMLIYCGKFYWDYADDKKPIEKYVAAINLEKKYEKDSIAKAQKGVVAAKDTLTKQQKKDKEAWTGLVAGMKVDPKKDEATIKALRSTSYGKHGITCCRKSKVVKPSGPIAKASGILACMMLLGMLLIQDWFFQSPV
jgi:uncharacterized protein